MAMTLQLETRVDAPPEEVWRLVSDIEHADDWIEGIEKIEVLEKPAQGLLGFKWKETRTLFGKTATETMWITAVDEGRGYTAEAESHGAHYTSRVAVEPASGGSRLSMTFEAQPLGTGARIMWLLTGWLAKGATRKALQKDLDDVKAAAEAGRGKPAGG